MINRIPILGWLISFVVNVSLAVPFYICWTGCSIGQKYFWFLPEVYQVIGFWNCVGLFIVVSILKTVLVPQIASVSNTNESKEKEK